MLQQFYQNWGGFQNQGICSSGAFLVEKLFLLY